MANEGEKIVLDVTGDDTGTRYTDQGILRVKVRLTSAERFAQDRIRRELQGEGAASLEARRRAEMLSQLAVRVMNAPTWWTGSADSSGIAGMLLEDDNVIIALFNAVMEKDVRVARALKEEAEKAQAQLKEDQKQAG